MTRDNSGPSGRTLALESPADRADGAAAPSAARQAMQARFLALADGDPARAEHLRKTHDLRMAWRSARVRSARHS